MKIRFGRAVLAAVLACGAAAAPALPGSSDLLKCFQGLVQGPYESAYLCGRYAPVAALKKRQRMECDQAEYEAGQWFRVEASALPAFRFPEDGTIRLVKDHYFRRVPLLLGRPVGPDFKGITWYLCEGGGECSRPAWVLLAADLSSITYSPDRPADPAAFDSRARYSYIQYRRRPRSRS